MPIHSHPSIDGSTGSAGSRESSPADSPAYLYPQDVVTHQTNTQEQIQFSPEITSSAVRQMSVLRHHDVIYSNSSHSHLPLRKRPYSVTNQNRQEIQQPIRRRSTSPTYQRQSPTQSTSPYRISKPLSPVRVPVIVSNPYSGRLEVWRHRVTSSLRHRESSNHHTFIMSVPRTGWALFSYRRWVQGIHGRSKLWLILFRWSIVYEWLILYDSYSMIHTVRFIKTVFHYPNYLTEFQPSFKVNLILVLVLRMRMSHHDSYTSHITHIYDSWKHLTF